MSMSIGSTSSAAAAQAAAQAAIQAATQSSTTTKTHGHHHGGHHAAVAPTDPTQTTDQTGTGIVPATPTTTDPNATIGALLDQGL
jgi:hypothetical protein